MRTALLVALAGIVGCGGPSRPVRSPSERLQAAAPAVAELRAARFDAALTAADRILSDDPGNAHAAAVRAVARYQAAMHDFLHETGRVLDRYDPARGFDHATMRRNLGRLREAFTVADHDLETATDDADFALELCIACWERDWNHSGQVDDRDRRLLEIEVDADGRPFPDGDPRRRPTFHFDRGDVHWARAMLAFQRALVELLLAYRWEALDAFARTLFQGGPPAPLRIALGDRGAVARSRELILLGLVETDRARRAYLAETDDDREWLPSPRQKDHPMPLATDTALYATWEGAVRDLRQLVEGKEGISIREVRGTHWSTPPKGFLDVGALFAHPGDIVIDVSALGSMKPDDGASVDRALRGIFGAAYRDAMRPSPLLQRLLRMQGELDRGEDTLERKLRYLLWVN